MGESPGTHQDQRLTVYLETFGCQMNELDSQLVMGQLRALGYRFIDDWKRADVVLYNTCSVRERAEQKVWSRIGEVGVHKKNRPEVILGVIGCLAERDGKDTIRKYPQVDLLCGPGELDKLPMLIDNVVRTSLEQRGGLRAASVALQGDTHRRSSTLAAAEDKLELLDLSRSFSPEEHRQGSAYVRITRGCNKFCTYCVVPHTRGAEVHRPPDHIVDECKRLVDAGIKEITLLGQTVNHYHYDTTAAVELHGHLQPQIGSIIGPNRGTGGPSPVFRDGVVSFADLLKRICDEVPGLMRLRFVTSFPRDFGNDILQVMRDEPRICRYLHLPVQSGSDRMLKLMNRGYRVEEYLDLIDRVRQYLPDAELATDIICGFPTETEEDHQATIDLLKRCRFKNSFIFKYSPRPGTAAYDRLPDDVPDEIKKRRNNELLAVQSEISAEVHDQYVGRTVRVFVESISARQRKAGNGGLGGVELGWEKPGEAIQLSGRTDGDIIVVFEGDPSLIGQIVDVRIQRAAPLTLFGELVNTPAEMTLT
ncbi:MAG: tRNA (N6-isopentenyl adenosine(37)-C2)-methylthiotransferase MiaB [Phycisphaeraceae bacterium]